ncbi:MAG: alpha-L-arabinofuranosidase C-terminal domain-containing protein, partial [Chloroflexota bacterium]
SSGRFMPTYMEWDRTVLETCWEDIDYVSAHRYANNTADDTPAYLSEGLVVDQILDDYSGLLSYVKALKKSKHDVYLSFDEWNVWYRERGGKNRDGDWQVGPTQLEEIYNLEDALVCAQFVNSFIRRADLVKIACLAQIVNVIAPILTSPDGLLYQSIYYPFQLYSQMTRGLSLTPSVMSETYEVEDIGEVPFLDVSASYDPEDGDIALFLVNRSLEQELHVNVEISDLLLIGAQNSKVLSGDSPKSANSWEQPDVLKVKDGKVSVEDRSLRLKVPRLGMVAVGGIKSRKR